MSPERESPVLGADVVVEFLKSWGSEQAGGGAPSGGQLNELHDLVASRLKGIVGMADFDAESRNARGPSSWTRDRVQHATARAMAQDAEFAARVRALMESLSAESERSVRNSPLTPA